MTKRKQKTRNESQTKRRKVVHVDALPWTTVATPEMFDDAEGFFGLEEVHGVEVAREGETVRFIAAGNSPGNHDSDEFQGFDDAPAAAQETTSANTEATGKRPLRIQQSDTPERHADETAPDEDDEQDSELETNVFARATCIDAEVEDTENSDMSQWMPLSLSPPMLSSIARLGFPKPTEIQARAIPPIIEGHDVIGKAATGSGKTLAYGIPIVEKWLSSHASAGEKTQHPIALILSPTRELSHQITTHIKHLCAGLPTAPYVCSVTGGLSIHKQQRQLEKADVVVGTPGRLWEVLSSSASSLVSFQTVQFLVVDEADRLLTEGHFKEAEQIFKALDRVETQEDEDGSRNDESVPRERQTLVFSATFNKNLQQKLAGKGRFDLLDDTQSMEYLLKRLNFRAKPRFIDVNPVSQMAEGLIEGLVECGAMEKDLYLYALLLLQSTRRTLIFTNSISSARRLTPLLQNLNLPAYPLHSEMAQKARLRAIERFSTPKASGRSASSILVATDVAARGLDIPGIDLVVHYHVPRTADAYVHRSGRTARAEKSGISILLCSPDEVVPTRRLVAKVHALARADGKIPTLKKEGAYFMRTVDIDRRIVNRLKDRVSLAKKIADANLAKERGRKESHWMKEAADALGVEYDSDDMEKAGGWSGRGSSRKQKDQAAMALTKAEVGAMRAQLRELLAKKINTGVSQKYLVGMDVDKLLKGEQGEFLGLVPDLGLEHNG